MHKSQKGFTLVELIVVIVLLGILGVTALGRFQDLSTDAQTAANAGVASELSAAASINYAASVVGTPDVAINTATEDCSNYGGLFQTNALPNGYTFAGTADCTALGAGGTFTCSVVGSGTPAGTAATATIVCTQ